MNDDEYFENKDKDNLNGVAIIGMAARLPKAKHIDEFWKNLENKVECITFYEDQQLIDVGIDPQVLKHPDYVKAKGEVADVDMFDASFFSINPREAEVTDPQHRMLLECAWEAMEHAGYDSSKYDGPVGVFAGKSMDYYLLLNVYPRIKKEISAGSLQAAIGNDKDSLSTTISYRLNLTGPGITVQTSSSTSLVAVCVACQSLLTYQCDMALAGGITAGPPIKAGYLYQEGNIWSPDGHCRAFDAKAKGFVPGSGMGMVVLKRLEDALIDRDTIWAVIKGFAVNNDGYNKVSYSAPSVDAQAEVVAQALAVADVHPETIQYIETHGTGTNLGDPIEITALNQAFHIYTNKKHFCAIGSVKTNIGHLDNAAGAAGLIKVAMSLKNKKIPASLHFETPNPNIDWENSPFFVNTELTEWKPNTNTDGTPIPRRAGITSLGMGGTNAHVILEEPPEGTGGLAPLADELFPRQYQLILLSAKTETALENKTTQLLDYVKTHDNKNDGLNLADIAHTLKVGRRDFNYRRLVLCQQLEDAKTALEELTPGRAFTSVCDMVERPVIFMFSGQGAQYVNMAKELYQQEPIFRKNMDQCAEILTPLLGMDPRQLIYPGLNTPPPAELTSQQEIEKKSADQLQQTWLTQPVLVMLEYSLARMWMDWGIEPKGMIGHSIGEFTAACISGCMTLEDTLKLVVCRGKLMHERKKGAMLSVQINESGVKEILTEDLSLAAINSPKHCVVSGEHQAVAQLEKQLNEKNIFCRRLHTSHAFHSPMMEPIMKEFAEAAAKAKIKSPKIPFISGVTGTWIREEEVCDPLYWARQLRQPVRFSDGIREILNDPSAVLLEVGPGNGLCLLAKEQKTNESQPLTFSSIRHIKQTESDLLFLTRTLGNLWLSGVIFDWDSYYKNGKRRRIPLPTYPFERKRYWLEEVDQSTDTSAIEVKEQVLEQDTTASKAEAEPGKKQEKQAGTKTFEPRPALPNEYVAPDDDIQKKIAAIWEDILGIRPIGIHDNFFDLGGHSLLATLFLSQLQEQFQIRLEMRTIFEEPTIACAAELVKKEQNKASDLQKIEDILKEVEEETNEEI
jgi:acyl transferase domain-containing protein